jgi:hypothetical protein
MKIPHPYEEKRFDDGSILREFKHNANVEDLIWHQDKKDRKVFVIESNGWKLQLSSGLPFYLIEGKEYFIPKKSWHRVIKGNCNLKIAIHERNDKMQIVESQLRQHVRFLLKEEVYGTIATVYHGSKQPPTEFLKLFETNDGSSYSSTGWLPGRGAGSTYGHGLYTVWMKTDHQTFNGGYGEWLYKLKLNLHGFIIFDDDICQKVYGKSITPLEQLKLVGKENYVKNASEEIKYELSNVPIKQQKSAKFAQRVSNFLKGKVNGIVFFGSNDGPVVLIYDPDIVTPLAWTKLNKKTKKLGAWKPWKASEIKSSLFRASLAGMQANPERLQPSGKFDIGKMIDNEGFFSKHYNKFDDAEKSMFGLMSSNQNILQKLSTDENEKFRIAVAKNTSTSLEITRNLSKDKNSEVVVALLTRANLPNDIRKSINSDESLQIKRLIHTTSDYVILDQSIPETLSIETLQKLAADDNVKCRQYAARNRNINVTPELLSQLANDTNKIVRLNVVTNKKTPPQVLAQLANDEYNQVRYRVSENPKTPIDALNQLLNDPESDIRSAARYILRNRSA